MTTSYKSLSEQVNEIKNANTSFAAKKRAVLNLGITKYEADLLISEIAATTPRQTRNKATFTFGVEIECLVPRHAITEAAHANNLPINYEGYNHTDNKSYFKFVSDASIVGANPIECVSPVLTSKDGFAKLENACKCLNEAGAQVNKSTGLHVHIGAATLTDEQYINVFHNYKMLETVIDTFMAQSRRANNSRWCVSLRDHDFECCRAKDGVRAELDFDRYHKVNAESYSRHKTIEFRQHQGTTDYTKISNWVRFCAKLVEWSKKHRLTANVQNIDDISFLTKAEKTFFKNRAAALA